MSEATRKESRIAAALRNSRLPSFERPRPPERTAVWELVLWLVLFFVAMFAIDSASNRARATEPYPAAVSAASAAPVAQTTDVQQRTEVNVTTPGGGGYNNSPVGSHNRTQVFGTSSAANPSTCLTPFLFGLWPWRDEMCTFSEEVNTFARAGLRGLAATHAACANETMRRTAQARDPKFCEGVPLRTDSRAPRYNTSGWPESTAETFGDDVRSRLDPARVGAQ